MGRTVHTFEESDSFGREVVLVSVGDPSEIIPLPARSSRFYTMLLALEEEVSQTQLAGIPYRFLKDGLAYLCVWGPKCSAVHDIFDAEIMRLELSGEPGCDVMTVWHENETIDEALWHFLNLAYPDEKFAAECTTAIVLTVSGGEMSKRVNDNLSSIASFNKRFLDSAE